MKKFLAFLFALALTGCASLQTNVQNGINTFTKDVNSLAKDAVTVGQTTVAVGGDAVTVGTDIVKSAGAVVTATNPAPPTAAAPASTGAN